MILRVEREWNREPGWFYGLPRSTQIALLADFRINNEPPTRAKKQTTKAKRARLDRMKAKATQTGAVDHG